MPAKSKAQRRFFGLVKSIMSGKTPASESSKAAEAAKTMSKKDVDHFASTKESGLMKKSAKKENKKAKKKGDSPFSIFSAKKRIEQRKKKESEVDAFFKSQGQ